jgi:hypothetical protein
MAKWGTDNDEFEPPVCRCHRHRAEPRGVPPTTNPVSQFIPRPGSTSFESLDDAIRCAENLVGHVDRGAAVLVKVSEHCASFSRLYYLVVPTLEEYESGTRVIMVPGPLGGPLYFLEVPMGFYDGKKA